MDSAGRRIGDASKAMLWVASILVAFGLIAAAPTLAAEAQTHVFDPTLSLTGNCETSTKDPVADPGCPNGPNPSTAFQEPRGVTVDEYGDIYLVSNRPAPRIDVFDPSGHFITEVTSPELNIHGGGIPGGIQVDSDGNLYVEDFPSVFVFTPTAYEPEAGRIAYSTTATPTLENVRPMVIDHADDHLFGIFEHGLVEYGSFAEGNAPLRTVVEGSKIPHEGAFFGPKSIALDEKTGEILVSEVSSESLDGAFPSVVVVFDSEGNKLETMTGVQTPEGFHPFSAPFGELLLAIDESTGHLFIADLQDNPHPAVYELNGAREYVASLEHSFENSVGERIAIDNGPHSPNSAVNPDSPISEEEAGNGSYLFVPSDPGGTGHLYAFKPKPKVTAPLLAEAQASGISNAEAVLEATINPGGLPTDYRFEYVDSVTFERDVEELGAGHGFDHALSVGAGMLPAGNEAASVSTPLTSLAPGVTYRFRVVASNACEGEGEPACISEGEAASFATYPVLTTSPLACGNEALRVGFSATLSDCRAYELVTPAHTNGHLPVAPTNGGVAFATPSVTASGEAAGFVVKGGALSGLPGAGNIAGDSYLATRTPAGWQTASAGPTGAESINPEPGGMASDLRYAAWEIGPEDTGSLAIEPGTAYVRYPDGSEHLVGVGSLGSYPPSRPVFISPGAAHVIFTTQVENPTAPLRLEPQAPPDGTGALYDRTADGVTHVISLLPGDVTPAAGEEPAFLGTSADGEVVAFGVGKASPIYLRLSDARTVEVAGPGATFEGLSADGRYCFYLAGGNLFRFAVEEGTSTRIIGTGNATVVNIPSAGTGAYFVSPSAVAGAGRNPVGAAAVRGDENLYYWDGSATHFVGTLTERDVEGVSDGNVRRYGLGLWADTLPSSTILDPSRTTPAGGAIVFESGADLIGYQSHGASEIYRYDATENSLACLSCDPTQRPPTGNATLQTLEFTGQAAAAVPTGIASLVPNLSSNGRRAFFETPDALVPGDVDGTRDVYEWEGDGEGTCATAGGCVSLISSGRGAHDNFLFGVSGSGDDVFIETSDLLTAEDSDETPSVYDARVEGGFPPPASGAAECLGEACQPAVVPPVDVTPASSTFSGAGNVRQQQAGQCPKGKRRTGKGKKAHCVRKHRPRHRNRKRHHRKRRQKHGRSQTTKAKNASSNRRTAG